MPKQFVIEAVMLAIYGELMTPACPVEYLIPVSTIYELDELVHLPEPIMQNPEDDKHVRLVIEQMIQFFRDPFKRKKMEKHLVAPMSTVTFPFQNGVTLTIVKVDDNAMWGELFDPIETEQMLTAMHFEAPLLTDQPDWQDRMLEYMIPIQFYDIEDFEFAVEEGIALGDLRDV
ncbi:ADP-heptose synthase [Brevibacillus sp. SYP-B805]|uniref:ADP-heptose synthase n=1 Tax=Brevibacillus sp. SYP-B805 TaxID=1578199 RepID=UPI0013EBA39E|nr:ADP-heptose synthase [Brevibacillus sp. SYP-B805]NGQ95408.1 ADP-heptose synthase [Brevibacillus sp. SYP-B805]